MRGWQRGTNYNAKSAAASRVAGRKESFESGGRLTVGRTTVRDPDLYRWEYFFLDPLLPYWIRTKTL